MLWTYTLGTYYPNPQYYLWWDIVPLYSSDSPVNISVSPGDTIFVYVYYTSGDVHFYLKNESTATYTSFSVSASGLLGQQAEWITERTEQCYFSCVYPPLANFPAVTFTGAQAEVGSYWQGVEAYSAENYTMHDPYNDDTEQPDASAGSIGSSGDNFTLTWQHYGDTDASGT